MTGKWLTTFLPILFLIQSVYAQQASIAIIPKPLHVTNGPGRFTVAANTTIYASKGAMPEASFLLALLKQSTGYPLRAVTTSSGNVQTGIALLLVTNVADTTKGAYTLDVTAKAVVARAADRAGLFNAIQSIRQLLPAAVEHETPVTNVAWTIPELHISDRPQFQWRGYMQDVSRTFYSLDVLKKYLDIMALYKMNVFHLHLTDDQGWRIQLKNHPELTSKKTTVFGESSQQPAERSGYYTQADIRELIAYAEARHITIVPEIDVPGHCWPIIITHPELGVNQRTHPDYVISFMDSYSYWGAQYTPNTLDPTKEAVYTFLDSIFSEIAAIFPSTYIHFGGDEVVHKLWKNEPHIQAFMKAHGMADVKALQSYFVSRVSGIIAKKGKRPIGWNDILADAGHLPKNTAIMSWLGADAVREAAKYKFYTVACPTGPLYFDIAQKDRSDGTMADLNYGEANTLEQVYAYQPLADLSEHEKKYVLGIQANMWPAVPQEVKDVNVQNFPRLLAASEIEWTTGQAKNLAEFLTRLNAHYARLDALNVDYYKPGGYIVSTWNPSTISTTFTPIRIDVTNKVYANGRAQAGFFFTGGASFLKVKNVKLLEDGVEIASDNHESLADKFRGTPFKKNMFFYLLNVPNYKPKARYVLQADIAGATGTESTGNITFNLSPYKPFTAVEAPNPAR
ncbi:beta-hexosaminidase [Fibrella aestuarina BUZ 2]|uniref:beta-N-acetylhexosaminidase n=1 Tax=Fibrella aestuarina BUZ 2 TaxID=1166018 RepID=I0K7H9_9BACT|nr:beta-N-acetylhexosaminidase [Fibrella aestuarina]CCH00082.1 beta-hexosaminidase [Fibrella aestuarina BUZ 2]